MNYGHFVLASKAVAFIANKKLTFSDLKKELPNTDKNLLQAAKVKAEKEEADAKAGGSDLFKGQKVWDVFEYNTCNFPCCIYSANALNSSKIDLSRKSYLMNLRHIKTLMSAAMPFILTILK